jgi:putative oxidoreductase
MEKATLIARILLGLMFVVFGLNGFLNFMPTPPMPEAAINYFKGIGSLIVIVKLLEVIGGLAVLSGRFAPAGLTILMPVIVNIVLFHILFAPAGIVPGVAAFLLASFLIRQYWDNFSGILSPPELG